MIHTAYSWVLTQAWHSRPARRLHPIKPKSSAWVLLRIGHSQMGILKNVFHKVQKPLRRLEIMFFFRLNTHTEVCTNDFMCVFSTVSGLPSKWNFQALKHTPLKFQKFSLKRLSDKGHSETCATLLCLLKTKTKESQLFFWWFFRLRILNFAFCDRGWVGLELSFCWPFKLPRPQFPHLQNCDGNNYFAKSAASCSCRCTIN